MRRLVILLVCVAAPGRALADAESRQAALLFHDVDAGFAQPRDLTWTWRLDGVLTGRRLDDSAAGGVAAIGEGALAIAGIEWAVAGGLYELRSDASASAEQWASVCLVCDVDTRVDVRHQLAWEVEPSLLASARRRPHLERRESVIFEAMEDQKPSSLGGAWFGVSTAWTPASETQIDMGVLFFRHQRGDLEVDAGRFTAAILDQAFVLRAEPVVMRSPHLEASGGVATMIDRVTLPVASVRVRHTVGDVTLHAGGAQDAFPMPTGEIAVEDRGELGASVESRGCSLRADAFAALTTLVAEDAMITRVRSGGVTAVAEAQLGDHASARLRADLGRGFHGERWGAEILATLAVHAGNR